MTEFQPLVSVIINCFNGEAYLREAIDSVINQTYQNWEIIFWDNQSTDSTSDIVKNYNDDRIHYYYAPAHTSLGAARNLAVEKANGEYINFLDTDDLFKPEKLLEQISLIEPDISEVIFTPFELLVERNEVVNRSLLALFNNYKNYRPSPEEVYHDLLECNRIVFSSVLFNKKIYQEVGGVNPNFKQNEDLDVLLKCALKTKIQCSRNIGAVYRVHGGNTSNKIWSTGLLENREIFQQLPASPELHDAIVRNETTIGLYYILRDKKLLKGLFHIFKYGSFLMLIRIGYRKIVRTLKLAISK